MPSIAFQITVADLVDARLFVHKRSLMVRGVKLALVAIAISSSLRMIFLTYQEDWTALSLQALWFAGASVLLIWSVVGNRWLLPASASKQLMRDKALQGEVTVAWDDEQVTMKGSHGESRWPWKEFYRWQESPGGLLLWPGERTYYYLPKRSLTELQLAEVREALSRVAKAA